jgi:hypothetical protein
MVLQGLFTHASEREIVAKLWAFTVEVASSFPARPPRNKYPTLDGGALFLLFLP